MVWFDTGVRILISVLACGMPVWADGGEFPTEGRSGAAAAMLLVDCNGNGEPDDRDILFGISEDCNANAVPDECDTDGRLRSSVLPSFVWVRLVDAARE